MEIYEADKIEIQSRHAFLTSLNSTNRQKFERKLTKNTHLNTTRSDFSNELISSTINKFNNQNDPLNATGETAAHMNSGTSRRGNNLNRSIKEFSFFDWSKVKLHDSQADGDYYKLLAFNCDNMSSTTLPISKQKNNFSIELPQVITIRFA